MLLAVRRVHESALPILDNAAKVHHVFSVSIALRDSLLKSLDDSAAIVRIINTHMFLAQLGTAPIFRIEPHVHHERSTFFGVYCRIIAKLGAGPASLLIRARRDGNLDVGVPLG